MIYGIGTDLVEVQRIADKVAKPNGFKEKTFTTEEIAYCEKEKFAAQHFAARFAAKEALSKALGTGWYGQCEITDASVLNDSNGKPSLHAKGALKDILDHAHITNIHLSMSHTAEMATATVVLECK